MTIREYLKDKVSKRILDGRHVRFIGSVKEKTKFKLEKKGWTVDLKIGVAYKIDLGYKNRKLSYIGI